MGMGMARMLAEAQEDGYADNGDGNSGEGGQWWQGRVTVASEW